MENTTIYGEMKIKSGEYAEEIIKALIDKGFLVARTGCDYTKTWYEILKKTQ